MGRLLALLAAEKRLLLVQAALLLRLLQLLVGELPLQLVGQLPLHLALQDSLSAGCEQVRCGAGVCLTLLCCLLCACRILWCSAEV